MTLSIDNQNELLQRCIAEGLDLEAELHRLGLSYDDLRYRESALPKALFPPRSTESELIKVENLQAERHGIPTVSFFSGCGGMDIGFDCAGFSNLAAVEKSELFCRTLRENRVAGRVVGPPDASGDAKKREEIAAVLEEVLGPCKGGFPGVFHGGPPCQSFSIAANQRFAKGGDNFKRVGFNHSDYGTLLFDYVWYILRFRPQAFLIENVPGLLTVDGGEQIADAMAQLRSAGYAVSGPAVLNAAHYRVPQSRLRVFVVGHRRHQRPFAFPEPCPAEVPCGTVFEQPVAGAPNHVTRKHKAESVLRYMELGFGERDHLGRVDRLDPRLPSKTVIAGGTKGGGRSHLHPFIPRTLSVRECARLQTFPDAYEFQGTPARQFTQVGNAVPPLLAFALAAGIYEQVFGSGGRGDRVAGGRAGKAAMPVGG